jgi:hypothetical protein
VSDATPKPTLEGKALADAVAATIAGAIGYDPNLDDHGFDGCDEDRPNIRQFKALRDRGIDPLAFDDDEDEA